VRYAIAIPFDVQCKGIQSVELEDRRGYFGVKELIVFGDSRHDIEIFLQQVEQVVAKARQTL